MNITYGIKSWPYRVSNNFTLRNSLFGVVKLTKNVDPDKRGDVRGTFSLSNGGIGKNAVIFGADMSSSVHADNKEKIS